MDKLQLLLLTFLIAAWGLLGTGCTVEPGPEPILTVGDYRDPDIPNQISTAPFEGESYSASVPDTLNLTYRAELALNALTSVLDPEQDYEQYFLTDFRRDPPLLIKAFGGLTNINPKLLEALPLMRIMSGSTLNAEVDARLMGSILHITGRDGLHYYPAERPWAFFDNAVKRKAQPYADLWGEGRMILAYSMWYQHDDNPLWKQLAERKVNRLLEIGVRQGDTHYFTRIRGYTPGEELSEEGLDKEGMIGQPAAYMAGSILHGASLYHRLTGYEPALKLAAGLANYIRRHGEVIQEDGRFLGSHAHHTTYVLIGMLEYALASGDRELIEWVRRGYDYSLELGDTTVGFFGQEAPPQDFYKTGAARTESCQLADMLVLGLKLSKTGIKDYWEILDRIVRNHFVELQMTSADWVDQIPDWVFDDPDIQREIAEFDDESMTDDPRQVTTKNAAQRSVGSWAGWDTANDLWNPYGGPGLMRCCTGNGARTLYYVWDSIVEKDGNTLRVNFLLNRASPWLDVDSHLPYEGKVQLKAKTRGSLAVRIPAWVDKAAVSCRVNDRRIARRWRGDYLLISSVRSGDSVTLEFPMLERQEYRLIGGIPYRVSIKGNTVIEIDPPGRIYPLYQRQHFRRNKALIKEVTRFVSSERIRW